ncbi:MAG: flagellar hook-basal body complex protein FliE [Firmicutes bacterium]|nr:flagellar hook-basal body complex protein FliE [Bacillota bacterium]
MKINAVNQPMLLKGNHPERETETLNFGEMLNGMLVSTDKLQKEADDVTQAFVLGQHSIEVHDVVLAAEKARLALDLTVTIRNKLVEAYQEIMRMQI